MGQDPDAIRREIENTRDRMGDTVEALGYKADVPSRTKEKVSGTVTGVRDRIVGAAGDAKERVAGAADSVNEATPSSGDVKHAARRGASIAQENPLGLAIGSVAVGFLAGMLIPSTRVENEKLGPVADQVKEQVKETGQEALEHGKQVAQDVASSVQDTAQQAKDDVVQSAQQSAQDHAQQVKDTAQQNAEQVREQAPSGASPRPIGDHVSGVRCPPRPRRRVVPAGA
jgi:gas vesicle protein